jgi:hypothetical protein
MPNEAVSCNNTLNPCHLDRLRRSLRVRRSGEIPRMLPPPCRCREFQPVLSPAIPLCSFPQIEHSASQPSSVAILAFFAVNGWIFAPSPQCNRKSRRSVMREPPAPGSPASLGSPQNPMLVLWGGSLGSPQNPMLVLWGGSLLLACWGGAPLGATENSPGDTEAQTSVHAGDETTCSRGRKSPVKIKKSPSARRRLGA